MPAYYQDNLSHVTELIEGPLAVLGGLADGVLEYHLGSGTMSPDLLNQILHPFDRLRGLGHYPEAFGKRQGFYFRIAQNHVSSWEIPRQPLYFHVTLLPYHDRRISLQNQT